MDYSKAFLSNPLCTHNSSLEGAMELMAADLVEGDGVLPQDGGREHGHLVPKEAGALIKRVREISCKSDARQTQSYKPKVCKKKKQHNVTIIITRCASTMYMNMYMYECTFQ